LKTTILLVEDSKIQRLTNERILHKAGYTVLNAGDGEEALRVARNSIPDVILLDMLLPKLGGREVMQALKKDPPTAQIPILVFSSLPQTNEERLREDGAAGYFEKARLVEGAAGGEKELIDLIENIVQKSRKATSARGTNEPPWGRSRGQLISAVRPTPSVTSFDFLSKGCSQKFDEIVKNLLHTKPVKREDVKVSKRKP
jgi:CheY-like chemotaxis protein